MHDAVIGFGHLLGAADRIVALACRLRVPGMDLFMTLRALNLSGIHAAAEFGPQGLRLVLSKKW